MRKENPSSGEMHSMIAKLAAALQQVYKDRGLDESDLYVIEGLGSFTVQSLLDEADAMLERSRND